MYKQVTKEAWYDSFMEALFERYPNKTQMVSALMNLLFIEREAAYRRLRRDVAFSVQEIVKISSAWSISLDNIINRSSGKIPFLMHPINYIAPTEQELQHIIQTISNFKDFPDAEFMGICNKLPRQLLAGFDHLNRFNSFKWMYQYGNKNGVEKKTVPFSQVIISEEMHQLTADFYRAVKNVSKSHFILDRLLFDHLATEILYFHSIRMITDEEKELIKKDLHSLLDYLSEVATNAHYPETKNKVSLYVSRLNIDTNYSYTYTNQISETFAKPSHFIFF